MPCFYLIEPTVRSLTEPLYFNDDGAAKDGV